MTVNEEVTFEEHRWYVIIRKNGEFLKAYAGGQEFSGLGTFADEADFEKWLSGE